MAFGTDWRPAKLGPSTVLFWVLFF